MVDDLRKSGPDIPALRMAGVTRRYGFEGNLTHAVRGIDLTVSKGSLVALMGHSGSGKSTLLSIAGGLDRATEGQVTAYGTELQSLNERELVSFRRSHVSYIFQEYNLIGVLRVVENVSLPLELSGRSVREARRTAVNMLELVGLRNHAKKYPHELSGGEQQRVAIARALADERPLILADEPTGALDTDTGAVVTRLLREAVQRGVTCVMATHSPAVSELADRVITMRDGTIVDENSYSA